MLTSSPSWRSILSALILASSSSVAACGSTVVDDNGRGDDGSGGADGSSDDGSADDDGGGDGPVSEPVLDDTIDPLAGTDEAHPPTGIWAMSVQYGAVGDPVSPTIPLEVEFRADGSAYSWVCAGAPSDGTYAAVCTRTARIECMVGTLAWNGARWRFTFPDLEDEYDVPEMGDVAPDGEGSLLLSYINPTYSGALFRRVAGPLDGGASCAR